MKKAELISKVVDKTGLSKKDASAVVDTVFDVIAEAMIRGEQVSLVGFGTFGSKERQARMRLHHAYLRYKGNATRLLNRWHCPPQPE